MLFENALRALVNLGLLDVILPFMLIFTVVFAVLEKTGVLGTEKDKPKTKLNSIVALILGFISVAALQTVTAVQMFAQWLSMGLVSLVALVLILGLGGSELKSKKGPLLLITIIAVLFGVYAFGLNKYLSIDAYLLYPIIFIALLVGLIYFIVKEK